jgi:hypothetical protein
MVTDQVMDEWMDVWRQEMSKNDRQAVFYVLTLSNVGITQH